MKLILYLINTRYGPDKVVKNLLKGLDILKIDYILNPDKNNQYLSDEYIIYSSNDTSLLNSQLLFKSCIGPNFVVIPQENNNILSQKYKKYILPSEWSVNVFSKSVDRNKLYSWAVGIDTDLFRNTIDDDKTIDCLIYHKNHIRIPYNNDLNKIINILNKYNQTHTILTYGSYNEKNFIETVSKCRYSIIIDGSESQGIAIQEIMSSNLPLFVWDCREHMYNGNSFRLLSDNMVTSVPYWDDICGIKVDNYNDVDNNFNIFLSNLKSYNPRKFILDNLSLDKSASKLLKIIDYE